MPELAPVALDPNTVRLPVKTVAKRLGVSFQTLYRWTQRGVRGHRLPLFRVGGRSFILESDLDQFIRSLNSTEHPAVAPVVPNPPSTRGRRIADAEMVCRQRGI